MPPKPAEVETPTIGRIIHVGQAGSCEAAIVTNVLEKGALRVRVFCRDDVERVGTVVEGQWHWPERA